MAKNATDAILERKNGANSKQKLDQIVDSTWNPRSTRNCKLNLINKECFLNQSENLDQKILFNGVDLIFKSEQKNPFAKFGSNCKIWKIVIPSKKGLL